MNPRLVFLVLALGAPPACFADSVETPVPDNSSGGITYLTGSYTERTVLVSLVGEAGARSRADILDPDHEFEFDVYVPENYDPSSPAGLLVYVSPIESGEIPVKWKEIFDRRNLIWVSVNRSGNTTPRVRRIAEARLSVTFVRQNYEIDPKRVYISGMSGGGQISSVVASLYPRLFKGGIFLCGVDPWSERDADPWSENPPENFDTIQENRYVFLSGTEDFKLAAIARAYRVYKRAGVESSKLIIIEDMGHELPDARNYERALAFLDIGVADSEGPSYIEVQ